MALYCAHAKIVRARKIGSAYPLPQAQLVRAHVVMRRFVAHSAQSVCKRAHLWPIFYMVGHVALFVQVVPYKRINL